MCSFAESPSATPRTMGCVMRTNHEITLVPNESWQRKRHWVRLSHGLSWANISQLGEGPHTEGFLREAIEAHCRRDHKARHSGVHL